MYGIVPVVTGPEFVLSVGITVTIRLLLLSTTTIRTVTKREQLVCDSPDSLQDETDYLNNDFSKNNYNTDFVRRITHSNTDSNSQTNSGPVTTATIPYIRGTSKTIYCTYITTLQYTCCAQSDNHFATTAY